jgi:peptidoglycan/LPS O-acetylase OafA/YrhL
VTQPSRITHIDAWRLLAVALVIVSHVVQYSHPWYGQQIPAPIFSLFWRFGHFGVQLFFCISGFVICRGMISEQQKSGCVNLKGFYIRRILRIVPPVALYMAALIVLSFAGVLQIKSMELARAAAFVCNVNVNACGPFLAHTWSLAYEEQFYILFPFAFIIAAKFIGRGGIAGLLAAVMCIALAAKATSHNLLAEFATTFGYMLTGCVAALYWEKVNPLLKNMSPLLWSGLSVATTALACVISLPLIPAYIFTAVIAPFCICAMIFGTPTSYKPVARLFTNPTIAYLGKISFTVYLWQQLATSPKPFQPLWLTFLLLAGVLAVAVPSYRFFELPLIRLGHRLSVIRPPVIHPVAVVQPST